MKEVTLPLGITSVPNPKQIFDESSDLRKRMQEGQLYGEFGQPRKEVLQSEAEFMRRVAIVDGGKVSHRITDFKLNEDGTATCTASVIDTPMGQIAQQLLEKGVDMKFGLRGFVHEGNISVVTFDLISK